jgi:tetratricopeptide (TPR) repeat protein
MKTTGTMFLAACWVLTAAAALAETPATVAWQGKTAGGSPVAIPSGGTTLVLFVMPSQPRTHDVLGQLTPVVQGANGMHVLVVVSGEGATAVAVKLKQQESVNWPIIVDADYALSGKLGVRAWPTTVLVSAKGEVFGHLAGLPKHYAKNVETHLAFAAGKIDKAEFEKRLDAPDLIVDDPKQAAQRHLNVAQRLLDKGLPEQARVELNKSLALQPDNPTVRLALARAMLTLGDLERAMKLLDGLDASDVPTVELNLLRGRALAGLGKQEEAVRVLEQATKLNPNPSEAWYELGLVYEHRGDWEKATGAFRKAFETTDAGRRLRPSGN